MNSRLRHRTQIQSTEGWRCTTGQRTRLQYRLVFRADESGDGEDCVTLRLKVRLSKRSITSNGKSYLGKCSERVSCYQKIGSVVLSVGWDLAVQFKTKR